MHAHHEVKVIDRHVPNRLVTHDTGVIDNDVDTAPFIHGSTNHPVGVGLIADVPEVCDRGPSPSPDHVDDLVGVLASAVPFYARTQIIDDDHCALLCQLQCVSATNAMSRAGHQRRLTV